MSANAKQILGDIFEQQRQESMPDLSIQDYFEIFSAEQIVKDYTPTYEEIEGGLVNGPVGKMVGDKRSEDYAIALVKERSPKPCQPRE